MFVWLAHTPLKYIVYKIIAKIFSFNIAPGNLFFNPSEHREEKYLQLIQRSENKLFAKSRNLMFIEKYSQHV